MHNIGVTSVVYGLSVVYRLCMYGLSIVLRIYGLSVILLIIDCLWTIGNFIDYQWVYGLSVDLSIIGEFMDYQQV